MILRLSTHLIDSALMAVHRLEIISTECNGLVNLCNRYNSEN